MRNDSRWVLRLATESEASFVRTWTFAPTQGRRGEGEKRKEKREGSIRPHCRGTRPVTQHKRLTRRYCSSTPHQQDEREEEKKKEKGGRGGLVDSGLDDLFRGRFA